MYHEGNRRLQDEFGSRPLADRLEERIRRAEFNDADREFVGSSPFFFLATADDQGRPDCSFKGGAPGFAQIVSPGELLFPDYDGNGMFKSLGNIAVNPNVGLLFIRIGEKPGRLRINGTAKILRDDPRLEEMPGGNLLISVTPIDIFPNCPRYIPHLELVEPSVYVPEADKTPVEPGWKSSDNFKDVVPPRRR